MKPAGVKKAWTGEPGPGFFYLSVWEQRFPKPLRLGEQVDVARENVFRRDLDDKMTCHCTDGLRCIGRVTERTQQV